jgi:hypothetical protein
MDRNPEDVVKESDRAGDNPRADAVAEPEAPRGDGSEDNAPAVPESSRRHARRTVLQAGVAIAGGVALGTAYVKPAILSVDFAETAHASLLIGVTTGGVGEPSGQGSANSPGGAKPAGRARGGASGIGPVSGPQAGRPEAPPGSPPASAPWGRRGR